MKNHPIGRKFRVTILGIDGTAWIVEHSKHVLYRRAGLELYTGEHNQDRVRYLIPWSIVDHVEIEEENNHAIVEEG